MRVKNNESIKSIVARYPNIKWHKEAWVTRKGDKNSTLPEKLRQFAFSMSKPTDSKTKWNKVELTSGNQAVIALSKVEEVSNGDLDDKRITQVLGNTDYNSFVENLKSNADITISQTALDTEAGTNK